MKEIIYTLIVKLTMLDGNVYMYDMETAYEDTGTCEEAAEVFHREFKARENYKEVETRCIAEVVTDNDGS